MLARKNSPPFSIGRFISSSLYLAIRFNLQLIYSNVTVCFFITREWLLLPPTPPPPPPLKESAIVSAYQDRTRVRSALGRSDHHYRRGLVQYSWLASQTLTVSILALCRSSIFHTGCYERGRGFCAPSCRVLPGQVHKVWLCSVGMGRKLPSKELECSNFVVKP